MLLREHRGASAVSRESASCGEPGAGSDRRLAAAVAAAVATTWPPAQASAQPARSTYASLGSLPDWSDWWGYGQAAPDELQSQRCI
jgi:hypothetical protein